MYTCREVLPIMYGNGGGSIVNVASVWGEVGASMESTYSAAKAALIGFTKALAKEAAPMNVTVNAVSPGATDTRMLDHHSKEEIEEFTESIPLARLGSPDEIAEAIEFLMTSSYITGQVLSVNGGLFI
jgi:3-oxoacyl-[acyl-carrier protein] reductase